ncbi:protein ECT2 isoform X1 [Lampetra fluviatilis]
MCKASALDHQNVVAPVSMDRDVSALCESTMTQGAEETVLSDTPGGVDSVEPRVVLVGEAAHDQELVIALEAMGLPLVTCETGEDAGTSANPEQETVVIVAEFSGPEYERLLPTDCRILGPAVLLRAARRKEPLPYCLRPLFCTAMSSLVLCFTGFRSKDELVKLVTLVHHMGGSIRKDFSSKVTHLVANGTHGDKYRVAVSMGIPIMREEWIHKAWDRRLEPEGSATDEPLLALKMPPFHGCSLSFLGFSEEDQTQMRELARMQGGECVEVGDERSSHLVVEENMVKVLPPEIPFKTYVVKQEWFWGSIQMEARAEESIYTFEMTESPSLKTCVSQMTLGTPLSGQKRRRRREATLAQLARSADHGASPLVPPCKRKSTDTSLGSLLNISNTPDTPMLDSARRGNGMGASSTPLPPPKPSARWQVAMELLQTESNYVDILTNIIELFKEPLERVAQPGGPILPAEEIKAIFSSIPDILDVHTRMKADLEQSMIEWTDNTSIGDIILRYSRDMVKAYPPFVNFFEMSKETIGNCEKQNPRFHAFLKINQAKPQCGRQSLKELLIRPVQRLPSVGLLLNDIMKHTSEGSADKRSLRNAIEALKEVMTHINEDKRKTEGQRLIFDIVYEVEGCPANLLSSHRTLVAREEVTALDDELCDRGETISMFLFTDCLEIARKRGKAKGGFKSPHSTHARPSLKHVLLMPLSQVKKVMDIYETDECSNAFGLVVRPPTENEDHLFTFQLLAEVGTSRKAEWLKTLSRQVANTICKPDAESLIYPINPVAIDVSTRAVDSTLSRASRAIKKTSKKVTRAFSFSKTPKQAAQRARAGSPPQPGDGGRSPGVFEGHKDWSMGRRHTSSLTLAAMRSPSLVSLPALMEKPRHHTISQSTARLL